MGKKKEVKIAYITLGGKARSFYDSETGVQLVPGKVFKIDESKVQSKGKLAGALRGGHVERTDAEAYDLYSKGEGKIVQQSKEEGEDDITMTKAQLVDYAKELGSDLTKNKLKGMSVFQLQELINELESEDNEDED
jgi:hypothetical protein